jgi:hypothetical protein
VTVRDTSGGRVVSQDLVVLSPSCESRPGLESGCQSEQKRLGFLY